MNALCRGPNHRAADRYRGPFGTGQHHLSVRNDYYHHTSRPIRNILSNVKAVCEEKKEVGDGCPIVQTVIMYPPCFLDLGLVSSWYGDTRVRYRFKGILLVFEQH